MHKLRETELRENFVHVYGRDKETEKREGGLSPISEFVNQVKTIVEKLTAKGLKLKPAKCKVGYLKMRILGHLCEKGAARIDPVKVECFSKMERPKSLQAV